VHKCNHGLGNTWGVTVFGNENNTTGAASSVVVECENMLLLYLGKTIKVLPFSEKEE
jgi:hypothetical protein